MIDEGDGGDPQDPGGPDRPRDGIAEQVGAKRPTSYSEQYQGTEFGRPAPPPPSPPTSRRPFAVAAIAVIAILVAGSILVVLAVAPNGIGSIGSQPSVPPSGSTSGRSGVASPSPTPTIDPGQAVLARFWTLVSNPRASYHLAASGKSVLDKKTFGTFKESIDVVGDEYSGWIDSSASPKGTIARKDGVIWVKVPGKARVGRQTSERYYRLTPFLYLEMAAWVDYLKPVTVNGRHLHVLRSNKFYRPDIARMLDFKKFLVVPDKMVLDVYVTDDGVPVSAVFTADVNVRDVTGHHAFHGRTSFTFSKFGAKLTIHVPKR